jgi:hypothetical protein
MSGLNNLHITVPQPGHYNNYTQRDRSSLSSVGSSNSMSPMPSPMTPISPQNMNWDCKDMPEDCQRRPSKRGVSTFISKLFRYRSYYNIAKKKKKKKKKKKEKS